MTPSGNAFHSLESRLLGALAGVYLGAGLTEDLTLQSPNDWLWLKQQRECLTTLIQTEMLSPIALSSPERSPFHAFTHPTEITLAALPWLLCYFDAPQVWRSQLPQGDLAECDLFGYILALGLNAKLNLRTDCFLQVQTALTQLDSPIAETLQAQLETVSDCVTQVTSAAVTVDRLQKYYDRELKPITLALYYLTSSPHSWGMSLKRAAQCPQDQVLVTALVGAIAGAYHSYYSIPPQWRGWCQQQFPQLARQSSQLWARWAGVPSSATGEGERELGAIAPPGVMGFRQFPNPISQLPE